MNEGAPDPQLEIAKTDRLLNSVNDSARHCRAQFTILVVAMFYMAVMASTVDDVDIFVDAPITMPFLSVEIPLTHFFVAAPWVFWILHLNMLVQLRLLGRKARAWRDAQPEREDETPIHALLPFPFPLVHLILSPPEGDTLRRVLSIISAMGLAILPVLTLLWLELQFLRYQDVVFTYIQRGAVWADLLVLWRLWPGLVTESGLDRSGARPWGPAAIIATGAAFAVSVLVMRVPDEHFEEPKVLRETLNYILPRPRSLDIDPGRYAAKPPDPEVVAALLHKRTADPTNKADEPKKTDAAIEQALDQIWLDHAKQLVLNGRRFRYAKLDRITAFKLEAVGADFSHADLVYAKLTGAVLLGATMTGADLSLAKMTDADLSLAKMTGADLSMAEMTGADLSRAEMTGAYLSRARMTGADLRRAKMTGADLSQATLTGADLRGAKMTGAYLSRAEMTGADLRGATMTGANLEDARMTGADLRWAKMTGAWLDHSRLSLVDLTTAQLDGAVFADVKVSDVDEKEKDRIIKEKDRIIKAMKDAGVPDYRLIDAYDRGHAVFAPRSAECASYAGAKKGFPPGPLPGPETQADCRARLLAKAVCEDKDGAEAVARRVSFPSWGFDGLRPSLKYSAAHAAKRFLDNPDDCPALRDLPADTRKRLEATVEMARDYGVFPTH